MPSGLEVLRGLCVVIVFIKHTEMRYFHGALIKSVLTQVEQYCQLCSWLPWHGKGEEISRGPGQERMGTDMKASC